jgi:hypothetical protein
MAVIRDYDFHPPDDARLFSMPKAGVRRLDDEAFVAHVSYGEVLMRHYAFRDHWFKVSCTMNSGGGFVDTTSPEDGVPPFTFNCDIATPMLRRRDAVFAVDLWLDVLVRCDGVTYGVYDEHDFGEAIGLGWLSEREAAGARAGLRELIDLIEGRELVAFLAGFHPFGVAAAPAAPEAQRVQLGDIPLLHAGTRPSW